MLVLTPQPRLLYIIRQLPLHSRQSELQLLLRRVFKNRFFQFLDTLGELAQVYPLATVVFVGGSLVPVGGHNVLEPAALALPVLFGPHMHNFIAARDLLLETGGGRQADAGELAAVLSSLLGDAHQRDAIGSAAQAAVAANRGARDRLLALIEAV